MHLTKLHEVRAHAETVVPRKLYFRIGEVARLLELSTTTLREWETIFGRFLQGERSASGQRVYSRKDAVTLLCIQWLVHVEMYTHKGAVRQLRLAQDAEREAKPLRVVRA